MELQVSDDINYGMIEAYFKSSMDNKYVAGIKIPMNNWTAREELAKSILLTIYINSIVVLPLLNFILLMLLK